MDFSLTPKVKVGANIGCFLCLQILFDFWTQCGFFSAFIRRTYKFPDRDERASRYAGSEKCARKLEITNFSTSFFQVLELLFSITVPLTSYYEGALKKKLHKMGKIIFLFKKKIFLKTWWQFLYFLHVHTQASSAGFIFSFASLIKKNITKKYDVIIKSIKRLLQN